MKRVCRLIALAVRRSPATRPRTRNGDFREGSGARRRADRTLAQVMGGFVSPFEYHLRHAGARSCRTAGVQRGRRRATDVYANVYSDGRPLKTVRWLCRRPPTSS